MYKKAKVLRDLRKVIETGKQEYQAVREVGVTQKTMGVWAKQNPRIARWRKAIKIRCDDKRIGMVEDAQFKTACEGNPTAQIFYLTNRCPDRWADRRALVNNTVVNQSISLADLILKSKEKNDTTNNRIREQIT